MPLTPHFAIPFEVSGGAPVEVEQDTAPEISQCVEVVLQTIEGTWIDEPEFGIPDETWGESVKAVLVLDEGVEYAPAEIERRCRAQLAGYKVPRVIAFAGALPRTGSGKVLSRETTSGNTPSI